MGGNRGQNRKVVTDTRQVNIDKVWQKVGESVENFPSLVGSVSLRPYKPLKSASERGEDRDQNFERYTVDVDASISVTPVQERLPYLQLLEVLKRSEMGKRGREVVGNQRWGQQFEDTYVS